MTNESVSPEVRPLSLPAWAGRPYYEPPYVFTTALLFKRLREVLKPTDVVLDVGAGLGCLDPQWRLRGEVARFCGIDVDEVVLQNTSLDEARVIPRDGRWPYPDATFDVALSNYVLEHVEKPAEFLAELRRVLKPGGTFFFRTVNGHHPAAPLWRMMPFAFQRWLVKRLLYGVQAVRDPYPTYLRANTPRTLARLFREAGFTEIEVRTREDPPLYVARFGRLALLGVLYERMVNRCDWLAPIRLTLYGWARSPGASTLATGPSEP